LLNQLSSITGVDGRELPAIAAAFDLTERAERVRCPVLVLGAGRDVVVPPTEAQHLAARLGERAALVWYERGGHCLYANVASWTAETAEWIHLVAAGRGATPTWSTQVDQAADVAHMAASHLEGFAPRAPAPAPPAEAGPEFDDPDLDPPNSPAAAPRPDAPRDEPAE
jgi:hypothetical protein